MTPAGQASAPSPEIQLLRLITGFWVSKALTVAAELQIADRLAHGPRSAAELAAETGTHEPSLYRLLRGLTVPGVFNELPGRRFELTPLGEHLRLDAAVSLNAAARLYGSEWNSRSWGHLRYSVTTGAPGSTHEYNEEPFEFLASHPEAGALFDEAMSGFSRMMAPAIADAYDFGRFGTIVDVAGGQGVLLARILLHYPHLHGVLYEQAHVITGAQRTFANAGLEERCRVVEGDFLRSVPRGGDAYMMKAIIHDWDDERAARILSNCRRAMNPGGRVLLAEVVIPGIGEPSFGKLLDLEMLVTAGGKERTADEYRALLQTAGLRMVAIHPTQSPVSIVEAAATSD